MHPKQSLRRWSNRYHSPLFWIVSWFGVGLLKPAPGSWGSLAAFPLFFLTLSGPPAALVLTPVVLFVIGWRAIDKIEASVGLHDAPEIVIDEVVGQWISWLPLCWLAPRDADFLLLFCGFLLFRLFDIVKPWPVGLVDRSLKGGLGVMLDDVVAGVMAAAVLTALVAIP